MVMAMVEIVEVLVMTRRRITMIIIKTSTTLPKSILKQLPQCV